MRRRLLEKPARIALVLALAALGPAPGCSNDAGPTKPEGSSAQALLSAAPTASSAPGPASAAPSVSAPGPELSAVPLIVDAGPPKHDAGAKHDAGVKDASAKDAGATTAGGADGGATATAPSEADAGPPAPGSADEVAGKVDEIFSEKKTFRATFKQEYVAKVAGATKTSTGTLVVEKPSKISFRYDPPNKNRVVSDGAILKIYMAEDAQMFTQLVAKTEYPGALAFIMGHGLRPSFTFTFNDKATFAGGPVLVGKPRSPTPAYESVLFYVDKALLEKKDPGVIRRVLVIDAQSNKNRFDFENASQPSSVDASEFAFIPPSGTTITPN